MSLFRVRRPVPRGVWAGILLLGACRPGGGQAADEAASRRAIEQGMTRYVAASNAGDAEALAALYTEGAILLPPDEEPVEGRPAITEFWRDGAEPGLEVRTVRLVVRGGLGYLVGRYTLPETDSEPADSGKYLLEWERQPDGSWRVAVDIWNRSSSDSTDAGPDDQPPAPAVGRTRRVAWPSPPAAGRGLRLHLARADRPGGAGRPIGR